jgi:hypothetical protein
MLCRIARNVCKRAVLAVVVGGSSVGCSWAFVNGPPPNHKALAYFDCTSSNLLPTGDLLFAGAAAVDAIAGFSGASGVPTNRAALAGFAVEGALFGASAIYGYSKTASCREAQAEMVKRAPRVPLYAPGPGYAPPPPPGFAAPASAPYDPWAPPPSGVSAPPMGPLGPIPSAPPPAAVPATNGQSPVSAPKGGQ